MDIDSAVDLLNKNEKAVLSAVSSSPKFVSEVSEGLGIDRNAVLNAARKLFAGGLVRLTGEIRISYALSELGKRYLKDGLPEQLIFDNISKSGEASYSDLAKLRLDKDELNAGIGVLRRAGSIKVTNDVIRINNADSEPIRLKNALLARIADGSTVTETDDLKDMVKRKIIEKTEIVKDRVEITQEGLKALKSPNFSRESIDKLTTESIKDWKGREFREYDIDAKPPSPLSGKRHITKTFVSIIKDALVSMGFTEMQSNYAESSFWNFDVMMFRQDHPDRDIQDTVYIGGAEAKVPRDVLGRVKSVYENGFETSRNNRSIGYMAEFDEKKSRVLIMRGHTTATTFRYIRDHISKNKDSPAKFFSVGKVFRNETPDQTHLPEFYQVEGVVYDDNLNISHLIGYIKEFYSRIGMSKIRLKPTYNPYTEPSLEVQAFSKKLNKWIEVGNSGVFRPETLHPFGLDKNLVAWGFGLDRMLMVRLGLLDIRDVYGAFADLDLLRSVETSKLFGEQ